MKKVYRIISVIVLFLCISRSVYSLMAKTSLNDETQTYLAKIIFGSIICCYSLIIIKRLKYNYLIGITRPSFGFLILYLIPLYIGFLIDLSNWSTLTIYQLVLPFLGVFLHAFAEELTIRGIILPTLLERSNITISSIQKDIVISSFIFGLVHLVSFYDYDFESVFAQIIYATIYGLFFGVLLIKGRNIYLLSLSHAIINFLNRINHIEQPPYLPTDSTSSQSFLLTMLLTIVIFSPVLIISIVYIKRINSNDLRKIKQAFVFKKESTP